MKPDAVYSREATLPSVFAAQVARSPESDAVVFGSERLTYAELDRRSNRLACHLIALGVEPGALVGVCLERSAELIVSLLAVVKAGGAYLPLDPAYPAERLRWMLADSGAKVVISRGALEGEGLSVVAPDLEGGCDSPLPERGSAADLAYVMYTSGSTGLPKGVAIPHRGIVRLVVGADYVSIGPDDRVLQASTPSFDASTFEIWGALLNGACLVGLPREVTLSSRDLAAALEREGITALLLTTALFHQVAREVPDAFRGVREAFLGGEAADAHLLREVLAHGAPGRLVNLYGPTESTVVATAFEVKTVAEGAASVPIGRAISRTEAFVVDVELRQAAEGEPGELLVGGDGLARGYWNRPDVTAERFVPNPFAGPADAGSRLYRTGDLVARRQDGDLEFLGRLDHQVKIRGFRIEPGEVEAALSAHPAIRQAHVAVRKDAARQNAAGDKRLVAYAVPEITSGADRAELRRFLAERLPPHMVPSAVVLLDTLPLTPNGKLDRDALPDPDRESIGLERERVAPRTPMEERLAELFRELLGVERPGVHDDFFALGGHSLLAGRLISRVRAELGVELPLRDVYDHPTLAGLAERAAAAGKAERPPIARAERDRPIPLSFQQERVWFLNELLPGGNIAYNFQATIRFRGPLDPAVLEAALAEVVRRHEIFRTRFPAVDGSPVQEVLPAFPIRLPVADLSALPAVRREEEAEALVHLEMQQAFDLLQVPLVRWLLIVHGPEDHTLVQVEHHFVHDGWSLARLLLEVRELYQAFAAGEPSPLPEPPLQYVDFAAWQRSWMQGEVLRRHVEHWVGVLAGAPAYLDLPADRPRPPVQSFRGAALRIQVEPELGHRVRAFARERGATLYTSMLAGFSLLMHRLSGQDDLVVGTAAADRPVAELEPMIGMMVNTLPLRVRFAGSPSFAELAARVQAVALDAYGWQDVPLERVVEALAPVRDPSRNPLFQVMFSFHDSPVPDLDFCGLDGELTYRHNSSAKNDLNIIGIPRAEQRVGREARPEDDVITLMWEYAADLFDESTMRRMVGQYMRLLSAALDEPDRRADELPLLAEEEARQVLVEWNRTAAPLESGIGVQVCVHELVARRAEESPDALAVAGEDGSLTYGELFRRARSLASHLGRMGVEPESRVGVFAERSPELVTGLLGVLAAGGAYLPIDPAYPPDRIAFVLGDARAPVLLTTSGLSGRVPPSYGGRVLLLDEPLDCAAGPLPEVDAGQLAYVIYTSGSTGRPKGVQIEHRSLLNLVEWHRREYGVRPADRATLVASPGFDASVWEIWPYLTAGAGLHVPTEAVRSEPAALAAWLESEGITITFLPTPLAEAVLEETPRGASPRLLRYLLTGGDALHRGADESAPFELVNHYGPTENTVVATATPVARGAQRPPIGRPISNVRIYVLDPLFQPQPVGVPGELFVGGGSLARGYLDRPDLTAERFVPDPFAEEPGGRLYRTGDRVRYLPDGSIDFLGRVDFQIKVRGFRIELGEIEAAVLEHPAVREAAVVARDEPLRLVAYVAARGERLEDELRERLAARLPSYMVPSAFVVLPELPLGAHGKIDRSVLAGLPAPEVAAEARVEPRTPLERRLAAMWAELLPGGSVGVHDGFFERGGHSLLATRLLARVGRELGVEVRLGRFLQSPTVAELARLVEEARGTSSEVLTRGAGRESAPLSFPQRRLWFLEQLEPGTAVYNVPLIWRLSGPLDVPALERSLAEIVRRHEILRTVFRSVEGEPVQSVMPLELTLPVIELEEREADRLARAEARRPFDLASGPLLRPLLLRLAPGEHRLLLNLHHLACDGPSAAVLARELEALYAAFREDRPSPLPELPLQYADFADWQVRHLRGPALEALLAHWRKRLEGIDEIEALPTDRPRPAVQSYRGDHLAFELPAEVLEPLEALARRRGASLFTVLLAGFFSFLQQHTGGDEVVAGTPVANRDRAELEPLIGMFSNTLVLRALVGGKTGGDPGFLELLERVRAETLEALAHRELPFEKLVEELQPRRDLGRSPLFDVLFSYREGEIESLRLPGLKVEPLDSGTGTAKFDLSLSISRSEGRLRLRLEYATDLFDRATAERMAARLRTRFAALAQDPGRRLSELPLLPVEERCLLLEIWNQTAAGVPEGLIHERIAAQAARTPDAVALAGSFTYAELQERALVLARHLRRLGVGPEVPVGIHLERSPDLVAALLGALHAGGGYLPLDPAYPEERIGFMLAHSGAPVVVTSRRLAGSLPPGPELLCVEDLDPAPDIELPVPGGADHLAYILYTSGSTGRLKGVQVAHRNVINLFAAMDTILGTEPGTWLAATRLSFDISVVELLWTLARGFQVVLADERRSLAGQLAGVTHFQCTPSLAQALAADPEARAALLPLRKLVLGGEALTPALAGDLCGLIQGELINGYGPTEATVYSVMHPVRPGEPTVPIGKPVANTRAYLLDREGNPAPLGAPAELALGGAGVSRGYLARPDLTAERFVPDPFSDSAGQLPGARLYRTGDLARWRPDGELEYLGRLDHQVRVRGYRVELGAIEARLESHPGVGRAVAAARADRLVAWVLPRQEPAPGPAELREWLGRELPEFMVPSLFVILAELPLTSSGKVDRKALPDPEPPRQEAAREPQGPVEKRLAAIWQEVLGTGKVGRDESFFDLGGHSHLVMRVVVRVRDLLGIELPPRALFEAPTLAGLAARIDLARQGGQLQPLRRLGRERNGTELPLSSAQQRLWFLDRMQPGSAVYSLPALARFAGPLQPAILEAALAEVVRRHDALRTTFEMSAASADPVQIVHPPAGWSLPVIDVAPLPERQTEAERIAREEARRPFDLQAGPLLRTVLLRLGPEEHRLLLNLHHMVSDGWSLEVLQREIGLLYGAFAEGRPSPLPELPMQYPDYTVWQRSRIEAGELDADLAFWRERLADPPALDLPVDRPRPAVWSARGDALRMELPPELTGRLERFAQDRGATPFMTLLAGFLTLLHRYTGQEDLLVGTPVAGRSRVEVEGLIGLFVNTLPLRVGLEGEPTFHELLARVREAALAAYAHQDLPFERLVAELAPERDLSRNPLFQVLFALLEGREPAPVAPGLTMGSPEAVHPGTAKLDLSLHVGHTAGRLRMLAEYSTDLFDRATVVRMCGGFRRLLEEAVVQPDTPVSRLTLVDEAERAQLAAWDGAAHRGHPAGLLHGLFEDQARRTPGALALVAGEDRLTYADLEERSAGLARRLRAQGAGPEVGIAVCLERTADLVVALLAVLRSGSFYVPLDPRHPAERLAFLLEDSSARLVVTRSRIASERLPSKARSLLLDGPETGASAALPAQVAPGNLAYLIYTSGSTGRPKAVAIEHRSAVAFAHWAREAFSPGELRAVLASTAVTFDLSVFELFVTLAWGGTVVLVESALAEIPAGVEVTLVNTVPSAMAELLRDGRLPASVRTINLAGEALPRWLADRAYARPETERLCNLYGPSEDTTYSTWTVVKPASDLPPSIGRPVHDTLAYVLDRNFERLPAGVPGELCVAGAGLARGYLGRPELTAERFVPDPHAAEPGARMYRTGDLAKLRADGDLEWCLEYLGRLDHQVKVRGFRVEPGEIEAELVRQPGVEAALVLARDQRLVAYLVAAGTSAPELRQALLRTLPEPMVPSAFVFLDAFPLTPHGKVDRRALPAPDALRPAGGYVPPQTAVEREVARVWADVLGVERVGTNDSFWELGGHSLLATRMLARLDSSFGVSLPLSALFAAPTLAGISALLSEGVLASQGEAEIEEALAELRELSPEEVRALLDQTVRELENLA